jgi:3-dehydro-L-gulonate 2-dehydrogenase
MAEPQFIQVSFREMFLTFESILLKEGFAANDASITAHVFATNSLEGVYTHGVNRFPRFIQYSREGFVKVNAVPSRLHHAGGIEQWDGNLGPGILNALQITDRAMELASEHGIGCVALANTNHWMRGGYYGWHAARKGFVFIGWTNTLANMPAWGAVDVKLGNNPLVIAIPYGDDAIVLDMAMSQYSYGALELYQMKGEELPTVGGFDEDGKFSQDPAAIRKSGRVMPIGFWKGAGLSLLLDILAAALSGGLSTREVSSLKAEHSLSQVYIAIDLSKLAHYGSIQDVIQSIIDDYRKSVSDDGRPVRYPGERVIEDRAKNTRNGIPVLAKVWEEIKAL